MIFSRLHFSSELTSCRHWWLAWGKFKCYVICLMSFRSWNTDWVIHEAWDVHSCLFLLKTSSKVERLKLLALALRAAVWTEVFIQRSVTLSKSAKTAFIVEFPWKKNYNLKDDTLFLSNIKLEVSNEIPLMHWLKQCCICSAHMRTEPYHYTPYILYFKISLIDKYIDIIYYI